MAIENIERNQVPTQFESPLAKRRVRTQPLSEAQVAERGREPIHPQGVVIAKIVYENLLKMGVEADDLIIIELPDGYMLDIPRIDRKVVFRNGGGGTVHITGGYNTRAIDVSDTSQRPETGILGLMEALKRDIGMGGEKGGHVLVREKYNLEMYEDLYTSIVGIYGTMEAFLDARSRERSAELDAKIREAARWYKLPDPIGNIASVWERLAFKLYFNDRQIQMRTYGETLKLWGIEDPVVTPIRDNTRQEAYRVVVPQQAIEPKAAPKAAAQAPATPSPIAVSPITGRPMDGRVLFGRSAKR